MQDLVQNTNILEFFRDLVRQAVAKHGIELSEHSEFYVVNLLTALQKTEKLFDSSQGHLDDTPLTLLLERAIHGDLATRVKYLKFLGDTALFVAGIFPTRALRHFNSLDYYIRMGGGAYLTLSSSLQPSFSQVYEEMGLKFRQLVGVIAEVGKGKVTDKDLLSYYERFLATGDARLRDILQKEGILPVVVGGERQ